MRFYLAAILMALLPGAAGCYFGTDSGEFLTVNDKLELAHLYATKGDYVRSSGMFVEVLNEEPDNVAALLGLGHGRLYMGQAALVAGETMRADGYFTLALKGFQRAVRLHPREPQGYMGLGRTSFELARFYYNRNGHRCRKFLRTSSWAKTHLDKVLELCEGVRTPLTAEAHFYLGHVHNYLGELNEAITSYEAFLEEAAADTPMIAEVRDIVKSIRQHRENMSLEELEELRTTSLEEPGGAEARSPN